MPSGDDLSLRYALRWHKRRRTRANHALHEYHQTLNEFHNRFFFQVVSD